MQDVKSEQPRVSRAAKENRNGSANTPGADKATAGVSAMRLFWENAGQKGEKPRAGLLPL